MLLSEHFPKVGFDFAEYENVQTLWANRFDVHPGREANAIAAQEIAKRFEKTWTSFAAAQRQAALLTE